MFISSINASSAPFFDASIQAKIQFNLLREFIWGSCTFLGPLIILTVTSFNPLLYILLSGFLYSGIIIIVGLEIVTLGDWYGGDF